MRHLSSIAFTSALAPAVSCDTHVSHTRTACVRLASTCIGVCTAMNARPDKVGRVGGGRGGAGGMCQWQTSVLLERLLFIIGIVLVSGSFLNYKILSMEATVEEQGSFDDMVRRPHMA